MEKRNKEVQISRNAMLKPRQRHIALTIDDDKIYVFGGESMDKCGSSLSSVESYFVERDMWSSKSLMKQKRLAIDFCAGCPFLQHNFPVGPKYILFQFSMCGQLVFFEKSLKSISSLLQNYG